MPEMPIDLPGRAAVVAWHFVEMHVWRILINACHIGIKVLSELHKMKLMMWSLGHKLSEKVWLYLDTLGSSRVDRSTD